MTVRMKTVLTLFEYLNSIRYFFISIRNLCENITKKLNFKGGSKYSYSILQVYIYLQRVGSEKV